MKLGWLRRIEINPSPDKTEFRYLLSFAGRHQPIEFETSARGAMLIMGALRKLQAQHKIPIPREVRPAGKPDLKIVTD
jgi:hypothetical protein